MKEQRGERRGEEFVRSFDDLSRIKDKLDSRKIRLILEGIDDECSLI